MKQLVCSSQDLCVCADTAKNNCLDLCWIIVEEHACIWEIVADYAAGKPLLMEQRGQFLLFC